MMATIRSRNMWEWKTALCSSWKWNLYLEHNCMVYVQHYVY